MKSNVYGDETGTAPANRPRGGDHSSSSQPKPNQEEIMKKMQAAGTPGPEHKALNELAGNWNAEVQCWMEQSASPTVTHGTAKVNWILGGRFLQEEFHGEMMGKPFTGQSLLGFDNTGKKFKSVWVDDCSTAIFTSEGPGENGNKVISLEGTADCPASGRKDVPMKQVFRIVNHNEHVVEMFNDGEKSMEIKYTRQ